MTENERDVVDVLSADHREFDRIFTELEGLRGRGEPDALTRKRELVDEVTIGLVKHSVAEETQVYPRVAKQVDKDEAEHSKHEHAEAEETMKRLERMDAGDPGFDDAVAELIAEIRHHVEHEEGRMFPELRAALSRKELVDMAAQVEAIKRIAPTRAAPDDTERRRDPPGRGSGGQPAGPPAGRRQRTGHEERLTSRAGRVTVEAPSDPRERTGGTDQSPRGSRPAGGRLRRRPARTAEPVAAAREDPCVRMRARAQPARHRDVHVLRRAPAGQLRQAGPLGRTHVGALHLPSVHRPAPDRRGVPPPAVAAHGGLSDSGGRPGSRSAWPRRRAGGTARA